MKGYGESMKGYGESMRGYGESRGGLIQAGQRPFRCGCLAYGYGGVAAATGDLAIHGNWMYTQHAADHSIRLRSRRVTVKG